MTNRLIAIALLAALLPASAARAQEALPGEAPVDTLEPITTEELIRYIDEARQRRLSLERKQVMAEIDAGILFDPARISAAIKGLKADPKNTWADNAERICKAYATVDLRFGKAYDHLVAGRHEKAAQAVKPLISVRETDYFAAAKRYVYCEALAGAGRHQDAVDAYTELVAELPDRFSFAALSLLKAAETYEKMHRRYNAMALYDLWVESFGLLDTEMARELGERANRIAADYADPLGTLAGKMDDVADRLAKADSGTGTQKKQKEIVHMLNDLIATAEEQSSSSSSSQGKQGKQGKKKGQGQAQGQAKGKGQGGKSGPASGLGIPSSPAAVSKLVGGGEAERPKNLSEVRPDDGSDNWGNLPPRERAKLVEAVKDQMPERYREMLKDYYRNSAKDEEGP
jgi:tetratricopeptide (TPR) repeat protein